MLPGRAPTGPETAARAPRAPAQPLLLGRSSSGCLCAAATGACGGRPLPLPVPPSAATAGPVSLRTAGRSLRGPRCDPSQASPRGQGQGQRQGQRAWCLPGPCTSGPLRCLCGCWDSRQVRTRRVSPREFPLTSQAAASASPLPRQRLLLAEPPAQPPLGLAHLLKGSRWHAAQVSTGCPDQPRDCWVRGHGFLTGRGHY